VRTITLHLYVLTISLFAAGCGSGASTPGSGVGGSDNVGGSTTNGSSTDATGGMSTVTQTGGANAAGGSVAPNNTGGTPATGGAPGAGGAATGGRSATGGASSLTPPTGGAPGAGGAATGGRSATATGGASSATGGRSAVGGNTNTAGAATGGASNGGGSATAGSTSTGPDCSAIMPTTGGTTKTGTNVNGSINGQNYGIWTNGSGGSITVFSGVNAFSTSWSNSQDFLAHLGLDFNPAKVYTAYGTITAQYVEKKSGTAGGFSMIGMYGWMHSPCIEWYINEDSWNGLGGSGTTVTIDGAPYMIRSVTTTGTGGANACESGHTGSWTQLISTRKTARQCGTVTVSDHFAAWEKQGWALGTLTSVHINVEVGGGTGQIDFPVANVTTTTK